MRTIFNLCVRRRKQVLMLYTIGSPTESACKWKYTTKFSKYEFLTVFIRSYSSRYGTTFRFTRVKASTHIAALPKIDVFISEQQAKVNDRSFDISRRSQKCPLHFCSGSVIRLALFSNAKCKSFLCNVLNANRRPSCVPNGLVFVNQIANYSPAYKLACAFLKRMCTVHLSTLQWPAIVARFLICKKDNNENELKWLGSVFTVEWNEEKNLCIKIKNDDYSKNLLEFKVYKVCQLFITR